MVCCLELFLMTVGLVVMCQQELRLDTWAARMPYPQLVGLPLVLQFPVAFGIGFMIGFAEGMNGGPDAPADGPDDILESLWIDLVVMGGAVVMSGLILAVGVRKDRPRKRRRRRPRPEW